MAQLTGMLGFAVFATLGIADSVGAHEIGADRTAAAGTGITITSESGAVVQVVLNDNPIAADFVKRLPMIMSMTRWGDSGCVRDDGRNRADAN